MSYDICATDINFNIIKIEHHNIQGGTFAINGTNEAKLNITFNYNEHFKKVFSFEGIHYLHHKNVIDTIQNLNEAINNLKDDYTNYYWDSTEGNAKLALINLRELALLTLKVDTDAIWVINY